MKKETKQKIAYEVSCGLSFMGVIGIFSAVGALELEEIGAAAAVVRGIVSAGASVFFGRFAAEIRRRRIKNARPCRNTEQGNKQIKFIDIIADKA